jgi:Inner membrane protein YgaP-like, transmembrane domain
MKRNIGRGEMIIRVLLGIFVLALGFFHVVAGGWAIAAYVIGAVALVTGVVRYCPAWTLCGITTYHTPQAQPKS